MNFVKNFPILLSQGLNKHATNKQERIINCLITAQHVRLLTKFIQEKKKKVNSGNSIDKPSMVKSGTIDDVFFSFCIFFFSLLKKHLQHLFVQQTTIKSMKKKEKIGYLFVGFFILFFSSARLQFSIFFAILLHNTYCANK